MIRKSMQCWARIFFFGAFLGAGAVLGFSYPPVDANFNDGEILADLFAKSSTGDGRIALAADTMELQTNQVPAGYWKFGDDQEGTGENRVRGNFYSCDTTMVLNSHSITLSRTNDLSVTFLVYESSTSDGTYSAVHSNTVSASIGTNAISSGPMNVLFEAGKFYLVAAGWDGSATYTYLSQNYHPQTLLFGESFGGYSRNGSPLAAVDGSSPNSTVYFQSLEFSTNMVVRMDSAVDGSYSTNRLTLKANLAGYTDVTLDFRHRESGDEAHSADGVFIATNATQTPVKIYDLDVTDTDWHSVSLDVDALASAQGITLSALTLITFQQMDNYTWSSDGRELDDIRLYSKPDMYAQSLKSEGSTSFSKLWKGFDDAKDVPLTFSVVNRGGSSDWNHLMVPTRYRFRDSKGVGLQTHTENSAWSIPAMRKTTNTQVVSFSIPAATKLTDVEYSIVVSADDDDALIEALESNNQQTLSMTVNHYSGNLWFDDVVTDITITNWGTRVAHSKTEHWIDGEGTLSNKVFSFTNLDVVKDLDTLDYSLTATNSTTFGLDLSFRDEVNGVTYWRDGSVELSVDGAYADIKVLFPAGLGVSTTSKRVMESTWVFENRKLGQGLYPSDSVVEDDSFFVAEETKPLVFGASRMLWNVDSGVFKFDPSGVEFVRGKELDFLEANAGLLEAGSMGEKKSNARYYRGVDDVKSTYIECSSGARGDARVDVDLSLMPGSMVSHFPYDVRCEWGYGSKLNVKADLLDTESSMLTDPTGGMFKYAQDCDCKDIPCQGHAGPASVSYSPKSPSTFSIDGGIRTAVSINDPEGLHWGTRSESATFAQITSPFESGTLYIPGHFVRGDLSGFEDFEKRGPAEILLSGVAVNAKTGMERPSDSTGYAEGLADYAGINFRAKVDGATGGRSILGGTDSGWWELTDRSKYYIRKLGVTGIHEAKPGTFPDDMTIYGYKFSFDQYGLSYVFGKPEESRTSGGVFVKYPCDITMVFEELMFTCLGELDDAELASSEEKTLAYWAAVIQPLSFFFAPTANDTCGNSERALCMGVTTHCANIDKTLSGVLGFMNHGGLGTPDDEIGNFTFRLSVPNNLKLDGPGSEVYDFTAVAMPYYNDYASSGDTESSQHGWINFAGNLDVSFFCDLPVQFHTSASTNSSEAPIYITGGWEDADELTFFSINDLDSFDTANIGFPASETSYSAYRKPEASSDKYRTRAKRSWLNVVELDYPLEWSSSTKSFKSPKTKTVDLMVLNVEHQTDYLSAKNAEISFGMQYDGLPQINLANMAFNALDEATGMSSAFGDAVGAVVRDTIDEGVDAMGATLSDLPEELFDPLFVEVLDPVIDDFYEALATKHHALSDAGTGPYGSIVEQYIQGAGGHANSNVNYILKNLADSKDIAANLTGTISSRLEKVLAMIDAFIGEIPEDGGGVRPGVLFQTNDEYDILANLGVGILRVLADTLFSSMGGSVNDALQETLDAAAPSLDAITEVLTELQTVLLNTQEQLVGDGSFVTELADTLNTDELDVPLDKIASGLNEYLDSLSTGSVSFDEYSPEEMKARIRQKITDEFYASMPCSDVQQVIRSRLYDIDAAIQEAIDSAFQQLNKAMRDLVSEYMAGIDDEINGMLDDLSSIMGSGEIDGYAHIRGDSLTELRLDGKFQWEVPDEMSFNAYLIIKQLDSSSAGGCGVMGEVMPEVTLGTKAFGIGWLGAEIKADIETKFTFMMRGTDLDLVGLAGSFEMVEGELGFEAFAITELYAGVAFGARENYLSANVRCAFTSYEVEGGVFFGKACTLDPFSWDTDVQEILGDPPFTGVYVYGEGWMPIVDYGCMFRIKAGVGAGIFAFVEGPVGGKIFMGASGEALCVVSVSGEVTLVGLKDGNDMRMRGKGKVSGRAGSCPFCVKFSKTVTIDYDNGSWDVDY